MAIFTVSFLSYLFNILVFLFQFIVAADMIA